ncbi:hypothetical protein [Hyphomonas adhaerens]|uniref:hypothetical protein n=1 Tax=Hyphomonas adhaerens TaxID=81029 RepID=UPI000B2BE739|nr:hypothetical protein [Hyphomonas adhaerens]
MIRFIGFIAAVVLMALILTTYSGGGPDGPPKQTSIAELRGAPERWDGEHILVTGFIGDRIVLMGFGGFVLRDELGNEILVLGSPALAAIDQTVTINGKFVTAFAAGDITVPVIFVGDQP